MRSVKSRKKRRKRQSRLQRGGGEQTLITIPYDKPIPFSLKTQDDKIVIDNVIESALIFYEKTRIIEALENIQYYDIILNEIKCKPDTILTGDVNNYNDIINLIRDKINYPIKFFFEINEKQYPPASSPPASPPPASSTPASPPPTSLSSAKTTTDVVLTRTQIGGKRKSMRKSKRKSRKQKSHRRKTRRH